MSIVVVKLGADHVGHSYGCSRTSKLVLRGRRGSCQLTSGGGNHETTFGELWNSRGDRGD